eukprot:scaffold7522_cov267-Pinguiococcus_pyrenoidosus.AAC.2
MDHPFIAEHWRRCSWRKGMETLDGAWTSRWFVTLKTLKALKTLNDGRKLRRPLRSWWRQSGPRKINTNSPGIVRGRISCRYAGYEEAVFTASPYPQTRALGAYVCNAVRQRILDTVRGPDELVLEELDERRSALGLRRMAARSDVWKARARFAFQMLALLLALGLIRHRLVR